MNKKFWLLAVAGILVLALAIPAFAAVTVQTPQGQDTQNQQWFNQMFDWHLKWLDDAQKNGQITPDQAKAWQEHFNYMRDFHNQYGMGMMGGYNGGYGGMMGSGYDDGAQAK
ncbi:hypothetical protein SAMN05660649_02645 [Desulfotomaculum arcticum]|uniref:DUF2680 domain-containing protein n=1 Tax=Desulfotruncus arcticus DSM 17038 TaxID=1121424 RepID=A0A1I2UL04_9FIRM|nr:hypothetical protein [Desulfotruncus arcticus]SFG76999.1 hypothetical protein SAMN05660649_02645 [Desulfotomaculum arcticum] [Desulfotruncus arcticus DSM 17038]